MNTLPTTALQRAQHFTVVEYVQIVERLLMYTRITCKCHSGSCDVILYLNLRVGYDDTVKPFCQFVVGIQN